MRLANRAALRACAVVALALAAAGWTAVVPAAASPLPDHRGYELVSPSSKNGGDVIGDSSRVHAATSEAPGLPMAATFATLTGLGDVGGTGIANEYLSERDGEPGTSGWSTHAITPPQDPLSLAGAGGGLEAAYLGDLSGNLTTGVVRTWSPLTNDPNVAQAENLYTRTDLRSPGTGAYALLTSCPLCASTDTPLPPLKSVITKPTYVGASADFSHVVFESSANLTTDASGSNSKLYESVNGLLRLLTSPGNVGCAGGASCSTAGIGARNFLAPHVISRDGSRAIFTAPTAGVGDTLANGAKIYEFDDHGTATPSDDTLAQVNASERTDCAGDPTCGGDGIPDPAPDTPRTARYQDASGDGSRVFFVTTEQLTDDAPSDGSSHLYMWSAEPSAQGHHLTFIDVDTNASDGTGSVVGVIGVSNDGHFVYFIADSALTNDPSIPPFARSIYVWHDETGTAQIDFVGYLDAASDATQMLNPLQTFPKLAQVTPDGRHLLFEASDGIGLTGYDHGTCDKNSEGGGGRCSEAYVYSADSHSLVCASCNPTGAPATANVVIVSSFHLRTVSGNTISTQHLSHAISDDGRRVFFSTGEALVPEDVNGKVDVYEYDLTDHSVHLISSGKDDADSWFMDASANGDDVFFITRERLVGWDVDDSYDLYDARVGGGLPGTAGCAGGVLGRGLSGSGGDRAGRGCAWEPVLGEPRQREGNAEEAQAQAV